MRVCTLVPSMINFIHINLTCSGSPQLMFYIRLVNNSTGPYLLVVGGLGTSDSWLFDINKRIWKELVSIIIHHGCDACLVTLAAIGE